MKLRILDLPDDEVELATWLDEQLAGPNLVAVVNQLIAIHSLPIEPPEPIKIRDWLGGDYFTVMAEGTAKLPTERRRELLTAPWLLVALQEEIDIDGGPYWNEVAQRVDETAEVLRRGKDRLEAAILTSAPASGRLSRLGTGNHADSSSDARKVVPASKFATIFAKRRSLVAAVCSLAAMLMIAWLVIPRNEVQPTNVAWGWNEAKLLEGSPTSAEYLKRLAEAGDEWKAKRPETKEGVAQRIREMISGCRRLIAAPHKPLSQTERDELIRLCNKWLVEFEAELAKLENNPEQSPIATRAAIDEIVGRLVSKLSSGLLLSGIQS